MVITVRYKRWGDVGPLQKHELLRQATLKATLWFTDGHHEDLPVTWNVAKGEWQATTTPAEDAHAVAMQLDYAARVPWHGDSYQILRIVQSFSLVALPTDGPDANDRAVSPSGWVYIKPSGVRVTRTVPLGLHPLLEFANPLAPTVTINALMTDITELWEAMHGAQRLAKIRAALLNPADTKLRVLAHLGGVPFAWFVAIPKAAWEANDISPHVFFMPTGFGAVDYDQTSIAGLASAAHDDPLSGGKAVNNYLLAPIDDAAYAGVAPHVPDDGLPNRAGLYRNVTNVDYDPTNGIRPLSWNIPMGMTRAIQHSKVKQVLFIPVRRAGFGLERMQTSALQDMVDTAMKALWTQSETIATTYSKPLAIGKYVLSAYSDSGVTLWDSSLANIERIKGVIAVEPQSMNAAGNNVGGKHLGKKVIPALVAKNIPFVFIGRHKMPNYHPDVAPAVQSKIHKLPDDTSGTDTDGLDKVSYDVVFTHPPDIVKNHFVTYRTYRLWAPDTDFLLRGDVESKRLLTNATTAALRAKKVPSPVTYQELIDKIFFSTLIVDEPGHYYHHQFAFSGGRKLKLPPLDATNAYYGVAVEYKTFFQEALEIIG